MKNLLNSRVAQALVSAERIRLYVWASLVSQILIVVTGGVVRLTGSGLGCPTWPRCVDSSYVTVPAQGIHGVIEFTNRMLTFVLAVIAILTFLAVRRLARSERRGMFLPALVLGLGIVAQAVLGGITVLTGLNSWIVGGHFLLSGVLIGFAVLLVWRFYSHGELVVSGVSYALSRLIGIVGLVAVVVGIIVTGAGPHAGDAKTPRNGLDPEVWQHYHSWPGYALIALEAAAVIWLMVSAAGAARPKALQLHIGLFFATIGQAIVGVLQARLGLPIWMVAVHMLGASVLIALLVAQWIAIGDSKRA
jgi:cytochrome c oxidase assembly protein subunit 15